MRKTFKTQDFSMGPTTTELFSMHRRGKSFDDNRNKSSYSRESLRSLDFTSPRAVESRSMETRPMRDSRLNDFSWAAKKLDLSSLTAATRHNNFMLEKGASGQNLACPPNVVVGSMISKFKSNSNHSMKSQAEIASTGDRKATQVEAKAESKKESSSPRISSALLRQSSRPKSFAQIHKSVQHMDIIEHDAELEQDMSVSFVHEEGLCGVDSLHSQIAAVLLKNKSLSSDLRYQAIEDIFRGQTDPFKSACKQVVDYASETVKLREKLAKKTKLEDVYLAEINKLQAELSKQSNIVSSPRSPFSASKIAEKRKLRSLKQIAAMDKSTNYK